MFFWVTSNFFLRQNSKLGALRTKPSLVFASRSGRPQSAGRLARLEAAKVAPRR